MSTLNIVLMVILSAIIGFAAGKVYGQEVMKKQISLLLKGFVASLKEAAEKKKEE